MDIPAKVREAARPLIEAYGDRVEHLGEYQGAQVYYYHFPDDADTGFPFVYFLKGENITEVTGFDALHLLGRFFKD